jgi:hypothetical protein
VPFAAYFVLSLLITGAYATALVVVGESLLEHHGGPAAWALLALALLAFGLWRWRSNRAADA